MPRPPSKHGLERKFKPWRRGKSAMSKVTSNDGSHSKKPKGSLRHQLRGKERLLAKLLNPQARQAERDEMDKKNRR